MSAPAMLYHFETLKVTSPKEFVYHVQINRPEKRNAMNQTFWSEMVTCFNKIATDVDCRAIVFSGAGKLFSSGIDLQSLSNSVLLEGYEQDVGRRAFSIRAAIDACQESFTVLEKCPKPVLAAVHGACIGAGVDLITACDMRYCTQDTWFQVKEIDIGIVADVGTLQRLPKVIGNDSLARELCYTARKCEANEARQIGLVSRVFPDYDSMLEAAFDTAALIASKSPVAVQGTKMMLVYARDHSVADGLNQVATLNQGLLQSEDVMKSAMASINKTQAVFSKL